MHNWFNCLYFLPRNKCKPELIRNDGNYAPLKEIGRIEGLMDLTNESFLANFSEPTIVYNGTHNIPNLDKLFMSDKHTDILKNQTIHFFFFEVLTHYIPNGSRRLEPHILKIDNEPDQVERIRCYELDTLNGWAAKHNIDLVVYCTDHKSWEYYKSLYPNLTLRSLDLFVSWFSQRFDMQEQYNRAGMLPGDIYPIIPHKKVIKKFFSGAWRYDPTRHFMTAFLAKEGITKSNEVSFYHKVSNDDMIANMWFDWKQFEKRHPQIAMDLIEGNEILQKQVPLSFETKNPVACNIQQSDPDYNTSGQSNRRRTQDPELTYSRCFTAIINETRVTQPWPNISEKTMNPIKAFRPMIHVAAPGTLKYLKDMGFKTFGDFYPEDYDNIKRTSDRLVSVCETIRYVNSFDIKELRKMYVKLMPRLMHNYEVLQHTYNWFDEYNLKLDARSLSAQ